MAQDLAAQFCQIDIHFDFVCSVVDFGRTRTALGSSSLAACSRACRMRVGTTTASVAQASSGLASSAASSLSSVPTCQLGHRPHALGRAGVSDHCSSLSLFHSAVARHGLQLPLAHVDDALAGVLDGLAEVGRQARPTTV